MQQSLKLLLEKSKKDIRYHKHWIYEWSFFCVLFMVLFWAIYLWGVNIDFWIPMSFSLVLMTITAKLVINEAKSISLEESLIASINEESEVSSNKAQVAEIKKTQKKGGEKWRTASVTPPYNKENRRVMVVNLAFSDSEISSAELEDNITSNTPYYTVKVITGKKGFNEEVKKELTDEDKNEILDALKRHFNV